MPKRFPLAAVLTVREQKEASEERALSAIHAHLQQARSAFASLEQQVAQLAASRAVERDQLLPAVHFQAFVARHESLRLQQAELRRQINVLEARKTEQQGRFLEARCNREMVTQLREKHENAWAVEQQLRESKRLDDLFSARRARLS